LIKGGAEELLLDKLLVYCRALDLVKARGQQRTDSTHVVAAVRLLNRFELVGEVMRVALNELAVQAPGWLRTIAPSEWYVRYQHCSEQDGYLKGKKPEIPMPKLLVRMASSEGGARVWRVHCDQPTVHPGLERSLSQRQNHHDVICRIGGESGGESAICESPPNEVELPRGAYAASNPDPCPEQGAARSISTVVSRQGGRIRAQATRGCVAPGFASSRTGRPYSSPHFLF
jgi:hypothetical protein